MKYAAKSNAEWTSTTPVDKSAGAYILSKVGDIAKKDLDFYVSIATKATKHNQLSIKQRKYLLEIATKMGWEQPSDAAVAIEQAVSGTSPLEQAVAAPLGLLNADVPANVAAAVAAAHDHIEAQEHKEPTQLGDPSKLKAIFETAFSKKLKQPMILLPRPDGLGLFKVYPSSSTGVNPNSIYVSLDPHGYLGKISPDGVFVPKKGFSTVDTEPLLPLLHELMRDPAKVIAEQGKTAGRCMFCKIKLTDEKSKYAGYGKQCARNYGLPYGETGPTFNAEAV